MSLEDAEAELGQLERWKLINDGKALKRSFDLQNFAQALDLVNKIGEVAEQEMHHPDQDAGTKNRLPGITCTKNRVIRCVGKKAQSTENDNRICATREYVADTGSHDHT